MKEPYYSKRQKIRGYKRRLRQVLRWKKSFIKLNVQELERSNYDYIRFWIHPWYSLFKPRPPIWLKRKMLESMIEVALEWDRQLLERKIPYDLQIWLQERKFGRTELLVTQGESIESYRERFANGPMTLEPVPTHFRTILNHSKVCWESKRHVEPMFAEEWNETLADFSPTERTKREQRVVNRYQLKSGEQMIDVDLGAIWVGRLKSTR
jgi:hypothetical protein